MTYLAQARSTFTTISRERKGKGRTPITGWLSHSGYGRVSASLSLRSSQIQPSLTRATEIRASSTSLSRCTAPGFRHQIPAANPLQLEWTKLLVRSTRVPASPVEDTTRLLNSMSEDPASGQPRAATSEGRARKTARGPVTRRDWSFNQRHPPIGSALAGPEPTRSIAAFRLASVRVDICPDLPKSGAVSLDQNR
jgi:hypothetical protein